MKKKKVGTREIVINKCFGGFGLSHEGVVYYAKKKEIKLFPYIFEVPNSIPVFIGKRKLTKKEKESVHLYYTTKIVNSGKELNKYYFSERDIERDDPALIQTVKCLGKKSWGEFAKLKVVKIPDDVDWELSEYDGVESVTEKKRSWG
jgi:hypothetical protein